jgi:hypothetical protein
MLRIVSLMVGVAAGVVGIVLANRTLSLSLIEFFLTVAFILGFAIAAAGWTIRRDI